MPHQLIESAMELYHIPEKVQGIARSYFGGMKIRFTVDDYTTSWPKVEKGIVTGCTISPILFGMDIVTRAAEKETRGPRMDSGIYQQPIRGFMYDLAVTTTTHIQARWVLSALENSVSWARMKLKTKKSRCLVPRKGRLDRRVKMQNQGEKVPSIVGNPIKCLGKQFNKPTQTRRVSRTQKEAPILAKNG